ncbi:PTS cellobiose transporter subunit IIC, partial [Streptococcus orisratti]
MDEQKGFFGLLDKYLMGPMGVIAQYKVVRAITAAGMAAVPFTIVGSMFLVFSILPQAFSFWPIVGDIFSASFDKFTALYMVANYATMGSLSLYFVLSMAYELTKIYADEEDLNLNPLNGALLALFAFIMTVPQIVFKGGMMSAITSLKEGSVIVDGWAMGNGVSRFGTTGIFTAIIMAVVTVLLYRMCVKRNWVIKMPDSVPEGVSRGFTALIPGFVVAFTVIIINGILIALGTDIFSVIAIPFSFVGGLTNTWIGLVIIYLLTQALWVVGIHGANIVFAFVNPIALSNMVLNADGARFVVAGEFSNMFVIAGGSGATLGLCIWCAFRARSSQLSAIGKAAVVPAIFNINEPLIFGLPIIYNPALAIPFLT